MIQGVVGKYEYVVEVDSASDIKKVVEDGIHERLEGGGGVREAEGHNKAFIKAPSCPECGVLLGAGCNTEEIEGSAQVKLGENFGRA